jgi:hypothetical protein
LRWEIFAAFSWAYSKECHGQWQQYVNVAGKSHILVRIPARS